MKQSIRLWATGVAVALSPLLTQAESPAKVGFIYFGPVGGAGWTYQHDLGRQEMERALGSKVAVRTVPDTAEGPDGERVARELSGEGTKVTFAVGFGYMREILRVASENPDKCYATASAYMTAPNVSGYNAKWHEGGYLAGIVAGKTTKSNLIGFVGAHPAPDVMWYLNGFMQGVRSVNAKATVRAVFVNSWSDPPKEVAAANALLNQGVDVMTHYTNSPAVVSTADARNVASISFHSDMRKYAPKHYLTGVTHEWGDYYTKMVSEALAGRCKGGLYFGGIKEGNIKLAPVTSWVPKDVADLVNAKSKAIAEGQLNVFSGPIKDNQGQVKIPAGATLADAELGKMNWYAEGILVGNK